MSKKTYILSEIADKDLEDIFDYTLNEFGFNQAETYLLEIEEIFQNLFLNPHLGKKRDEIKKVYIAFRKTITLFFTGF
jgi:toxin ParE1/3/4